MTGWCEEKKCEKCDRFLDTNSASEGQGPKEKSNGTSNSRVDHFRYLIDRSDSGDPSLLSISCHGLSRLKTEKEALPE